MTPPRRPLTPLERALLRAVVALGDDAYRIPIYRKVASYGIETNGFVVGACLWRLRDAGLLKVTEIVQGKGEASSLWLWRPAFDLTAVLAEGET
jgi:hypothetical protein